jgi:hypothetical protein
LASNFVKLKANIQHFYSDTTIAGTLEMELRLFLRIGGSRILLVAEVSHPGKEHGEAKAVGGFDDFGVALGASGLDDGGGSSFGDFLYAVGKREKGVGGGNSTLQRELRFHGTDFGGVNTRHLSCADANSLSITSIDDSVGFHVLADFPREE